MSDIELVIKIPEEMYEALRKTYVITGGQRMNGKTLMSVIYNAVGSGTPIPKGHGDLIDRNEILTVTDCMEDGTERCYVPYVHIEEAKTIIEAESEE